jgi:hypothetical protein
MEMTLVKSLHSGDPHVFCLPDIEHMDLQVPDVNIQGWSKCKCKCNNYILVHFMYVHVTHALKEAMSRAHM